jgi:hypothetical protein
VHFGVCLSERGIARHDLRGSLADDDGAHDDGLLGALVGQKVFFGQPLLEAAHIGCGLLYVIDVIRKTVFIHTGCASASTLARNVGGKSPGVSKSTQMPSSDSRSSCRPPKFNNVAPGSAPTNRSRSLPSRSVPCRTEPNRTEDAWVCRAKTAHRFTDGTSLEVKYERGSHGHLSLKIRITVQKLSGRAKSMNLLLIGFIIRHPRVDARWGTPRFAAVL